QMKQREKILLAGLVAALALWQGTTLVRSFVFEPVEERESHIVERQERVREIELSQKRSEAAARKLQEWKQRSLPPDPVAAASLYQNWLIELAEKTKLEKVKVTSARTGARGKEDIYSVISFKIDAEGTLGRLRDFLFEFRRSGLLH